MDVLHISAGNLFGGVETVQVTLARHRALCSQMKPHFALCFEGRLASELRSTGASVYVLGAVRVSRPWTVWRARRTLAGLLQRQRFDVVVCHSVWPHAIFAPVVRSAGLPLIFWLHDATRGKHWLERWAKWTRPDGVICNSRFTADGLPNLYRDVPTKIVYCPVAVHESIPFAERRAVRAELATGEDAVVVVQVGRLAPLKGQRLCLGALATLADVPGWVCWQVGGAQRAAERRYLDELKSMAARLGITERVRFAGQRSDVSRILSAADVYCQPNTGPDAFGITFIEALLAGLPIVTSAVGGAVEIVNSSCGILVPPADRAILAASLRRLILDSNLRTLLGAAGPARASLLCDPLRQLVSLCDFLHRARQRDLAA
jgi:glycosyltransferase involved in cell wall biosynthesis